MGGTPSLTTLCLFSLLQLDPSGNKEVEQDLDKCKEMINVNMQKDIDILTATKEERERLVGPERLVSLHRALEEIGVSQHDGFFSTFHHRTFMFSLLSLIPIIHRIPGRR